MDFHSVLIQNTEIKDPVKILELQDLLFRWIISWYMIWYASVLCYLCIYSCTAWRTYCGYRQSLTGACERLKSKERGVFLICNIHTQWETHVLTVIVLYGIIKCVCVCFTSLAELDVGLSSAVAVLHITGIISQVALLYSIYCQWDGHLLLA